MAKSVKVKLDKMRTLRFNGAALVRFESETGRNILKGELDGLSFQEVMVLLHCGCLDEDPDFTMEELLREVDLKTIASMQGKLAEALIGDLPKEMTEADPKGSVPKLATSTAKLESPAKS